MISCHDGEQTNLQASVNRLLEMHILISFLQVLLKITPAMKKRFYLLILNIVLRL